MGLPLTTSHTSRHPTSHLLFSLSAARILYSFINTKQKTSGLGSCDDSIRLDDGRLPYTSFKVVSNILIVNINSPPNTILSMLLSKFIQNVGGIKSSVITQLTGNNLKSLGHSANDKLLLASDCSTIIAKILGEFHINDTTAGNHRVILHCFPDYHDGIMKRSLSFFHKLFCSSSQNNGAGLRLGASIEEIKSFSS